MDYLIVALLAYYFGRQFAWIEAHNIGLIKGKRMALKLKPGFVVAEYVHMDSELLKILANKEMILQEVDMNDIEEEK